MSRYYILYLKITLLVAFAFTGAANGDVIVKNDTYKNVTIVVSSWVSRSGERVSHEATWRIEAGRSIRLLYGDSLIQAQRFEWRTRTDDGETPDGNQIWYQEAGSDGHIRITISSKNIAGSSGQVLVKNNTSWPIELKHCWYIDANGHRHDLLGNWSFDPNESSYLAYEGKRIKARTFRVSFVVAGTHATGWLWHHDGVDGKPLEVVIDYDNLPPSRSWSPRVATSTPEKYTFTATSSLQTIVFRLQNLSKRGNVNLLVKDDSGNTVAICAYSGTRDDRCMLHVAEQGRYTVQVDAHGTSDPVECKVSIASIDHLDILGEVVVQEGIEMLIVGGLVELLGSENDKKEFWDETGSGLAKDTLALALVEMLMQVQREKPDIDPLSTELKTLVSKLRGEERIISVRGAFLDELMNRINTACN